VTSSGERRTCVLADVEPAGVGYTLRLRGRPAVTPAGKPLVVPTLALAELLASERRGSGTTAGSSKMLATRLAHTAIDSVVSRRDMIIDAFAETAGADVLCYFAQGPARLAARQEEAWRPILRWAAETFELAFQPTTAIVHGSQPSRTLERVEAIARARSDFELAGLDMGRGLFGSAILTLALWTGRLTGHQALDASRIDETFQQSRWGVDAEAAAGAQRIAADAIGLEQWFAALR